VIGGKQVAVARDAIVSAAADTQRAMIAVAGVALVALALAVLALLTVRKAAHA